MLNLLLVYVHPSPPFSKHKAVFIKISIIHLSLFVQWSIIFWGVFINVLYKTLVYGYFLSDAISILFLFIFSLDKNHHFLIIKDSTSMVAYDLHSLLYDSKSNVRTASLAENTQLTASPLQLCVKEG